MAKEIIHCMSEGESAESTAPAAPMVPTFEGVVFKQRQSTADFSCSETIVLPGRHTADAAWRAVHAAIRSGGASILGGEIRRCGELLAR